MSLKVSLARAERGPSQSAKEIARDDLAVKVGTSHCGDRWLEGGHTMNLVLTTHSGFVMIVPVAPAVIAAVM